MVKQIQTLKIVFGFLTLISLIVIVQGLAFPQNSYADINHPVRVNGGIPTGTINCNISVYFPNNTILINYREMTNQGNFFNYTLNPNQTSQKGDYKYCISCSSEGLNQSSCYDYTINLGGINPSQIRTDSSSRTIYIFFGLAFFCLVGFFIIKKLPVKISLFLIMFWFILMGINSAYILMQDEVLNSNVESFFSFFLTISIYINYFIFTSIIIVWMVTFFVTIKDSINNKIEGY